MTPTLLRRSAAEVFWFAAFVALYYTPAFLEAPSFDLNDPRVRILFEQALSTPTVRLELVRNLLGHLLPLLVCHAILAWAGKRSARSIGIRPLLGRSVTMLAGCALVFALNHQLFPASGYAVVLPSVSGSAVAVFGAVTVGISVVLAIRISIRGWRFPALGRRAVALGAALIGLGALIATIVGPRDSEAGVVARGAGAGSLASSYRNVFVVGVDSLSAHVLREEGSALPNLSGLMASGVSFGRAYTPIGRTFPAWMSLLSGRTPAEHGAIFNLRGIEGVERTDLLPQTLRAAGYRTVFALDERRFANIDETFGFDRVVGPKAGVLDFVIQRFNEAPLSNLLLQTSFGSWLMPYSHHNVASHVNYDARGFVDGVVAASDGGEPVFAAVHFESGHFPFRSRHSKSDAVRTGTPRDQLRAEHVAALAVVDMQVGRLLSALERRGLLREALVVLVSDHGEGIGAPEPARNLAGAEVNLAADGHGSSVVSDHQNRIVLGMATYRDGRPVGAKGVHDGLVSLTDLRGAIERYASTGVARLEPGRECMTVETGIRLSSAESYLSLDEEAVAREAAGFYEIDGLGRMRVREGRLDALIDRKDVGLRCTDRITYWSSVEGRHIAYAVSPAGGAMAEVKPSLGDVARIEEYRERLRQSVRSPVNAAAGVTTLAIGAE